MKLGYGSPSRSKNSCEQGVLVRAGASQDPRPDPETEVLKATKEVPIERAYDFSFAKKADSELTQAG